MPTLKGFFVGRLQSKYGLEEGVYLADPAQPSGIGMNGYGRGYAMDRFYEGDYVKGRCDGFGRQVLSDGQIQEGRWANHRFLG